MEWAYQSNNHKPVVPFVAHAGYPPTPEAQRNNGNGNGESNEHGNVFALIVRVVNVETWWWWWYGRHRGNVSTGDGVAASSVFGSS